MSNDLIQALEYKISLVKNSLDQWKEKFEKNPSYAFEWSNDAFKAAAHLELYSIVLHQLKDGCSIDALLDDLHDRILYKSSYPSMSTSVPSNLLDQYKLAATSDLHHYLKVREGR